MVAIPKKDGGVRVTINYKKLNAISTLGQLPIPRESLCPCFVGQ
ncbi:unnamed protein product [Laminaria digitata]